MVNSSIINKALFKLNEKYPNSFNIKEYIGSLFSASDDSQHDIRREITDIFLLEGIAEYATDRNNPTELKITFKGRDIAKNGDYNAYLEKKGQESINQKEIEDLTITKLKYDVANSKRIFKTYWFTFGMAVLGFAISLILLFLRLKG